LRIKRILLGLMIGFCFYYLASFMISTTQFLVVSAFGEDFYRIADEGSIDITPNLISVPELLIILSVNFILVGPCEELFFRGVLFRDFKSAYGNKIAIVSSSLIFGIYHIPPFIVPFQTIITFLPYYSLMGFFLALIVNFQDGDLTSAITAHAFFNSFLMILRFIS